MYIANDLKLNILLASLSWVGVYRGLIVLAVFIFLKTEQCFLGAVQYFLGVGQ
jgi:predicted CDP-diglyceride synthetase/phosphatidate cytidylyltransferase